MELLKFNMIKSEISRMMNETRESLIVCSYSVEITNVEIFQFISLIEYGVKIQLILGKELPESVLVKLARLYNIGVYYFPTLHAKIYLNENSAIITSCNFGRLTLQKLVESGIRFARKDYRNEYTELRSQVLNLVGLAKTILPVLPHKPEKAIDLKDFLS
jgi:hypothetical protein